MNFSSDLLLQRIENSNIDSLIIDNNDVHQEVFISDNSLHEMRSCAKVIVALALGILIDKKYKFKGENISVNTKIYDLIKDFIDIKKKENLEKIKKWTFWNLLTHTTGYKDMLLTRDNLENINEKDIINYVFNYDMPNEVGAIHVYNNVEPFIISVIFSKCFKINLANFAYENIFKPLGITNYKWGGVLNNICMGCTNLYLKPTDFHKIGKLILNGGKYENKQIVSSKWVNEMLKTQIETPDYYKKERLFPKIGYGYYMHISKNGYVFKDGADGQYLIINKDKNLVITITAHEKDTAKVTEIFRNI